MNPINTGSYSVTPQTHPNHKYRRYFGHMHNTLAGGDPNSQKQVQVPIFIDPPAQK